MFPLRFLKVLEMLGACPCFFPLLIGRKHSICANKVVFVILSSFAQYIDSHVLSNAGGVKRK